MANDPIKLVDVGALDRFKTDIENEIPDSVQYSAMPTAAASLVGQIAQFTGTTTSSYTNGYFYKCTEPSTGTYEWTRINVQPGGGGGDIIDDEHVSTETTYSSEKIESLFELPAKTFGACSDDELVSIISKADAGELNPSNYWAVGDERAVSLSAMNTSTGIDETHAAQAGILVIYHVGLYYDKNGKMVNFIVGLQDSLAEKGKMNTKNTNAGSWDSCPRRSWCNSVFYNAIPSTIRAIFKEFKTITATEQNAATTTISIDKFALLAEKEVFGAKTNATQQEFNELTQFDYFKVSANRIKRVSGAKEAWFLRSPRAGDSNTSGFCYVTMTGGAASSTFTATSTFGISPFGCI